MNPMTPIIEVPFCHLPNSKVQAFDMRTCQRSEFQVNELLKVSQRDDFAYFVVMLDTDCEVIMHPDYHCQCHVMWYSKDGQCWFGRLGLRKFLDGETWHKVGTGTPPVAEDHDVYKSRCK